MKNRTRLFLLAIGWPAMMTVAACGDDDDIAGTGGEGQVEGRIANQSSPQPVVAFSRSPGALGVSSPSFALPSGEAGSAELAVVGEFNSSGTFEAASDTVEIDAGAEFTVTEVAAGRSSMVLEVRDAAGVALGRAILHGAVVADGTKEATPIDGESTAEANVFAELRAEGNSASDIATTELSAWVDFQGENEAVSAAASEADVARIAAAFEAGAEAYTESTTESGNTMSASARFDAGVEAAEEYSATLFEDAVDEAEAFRAYADAIVASYAEAGLSAEAQAQAGSAASMAAANEAFTEAAALAVLRGSVRQMAAARAEVAVNALMELNASADHITAVESARVQFDAAVDGAGSAAAIVDATETFQSEVLAILEDVATNQVGVSANTWVDVENQFASGGFRTELDVLADTGLLISTIVDAYSAFYSGLSQELAAILTAAGHTEADANAIADVFVAAESGLTAGLSGGIL